MNHTVTDSPDPSVTDPVRRHLEGGTTNLVITIEEQQ